MMQAYTVVGYFEETGQTFCEHVMAAHPRSALKKAAANLSHVPKDDIAIVDIFEGTVHSLCFSEKVHYAVDL